MARADLPGWSDRVAEFIDHLEDEQRSTHTCRNYRDDLMAFAGWYRGQHDGEDPRLADLSKRDVLAWKKDVEDSGGRSGRASTATVNRKVAAFNSFLKWAQDRELAPQFTAVKPNKSQRSREPKSLAPEARRAFVRTVTESGNRQHILIMRMGLDGGLRVSEMTSLTWSHIKITDRKGHMDVIGKGNKARKVPMTQAVPSLR